MDQQQVERPMRREAQQAKEDSIGQAKQVIDKIEEKLLNAYRVPMKRDMSVVSVSELTDLIGQLRIALPKAVVQAQAVMQKSEEIVARAKAEADKTADAADKIYRDTVDKANKLRDDIHAEVEQYEQETRQKAQAEAEGMVADAQTRAEQILFAAQQQAQKLTDDNEITRRAQAYAMETRERAEKDADSIYNQACVHTDKMLSGAAAALSRSANELAALRDSLLGQGENR